MRKLNCVFVGLVVVGVMTALAQDARFHIDRSTDFSKYRTYKWLKTKAMGHEMSSLDAQIIEALDAELARKGLGKHDSDTDLFICYHSAVGTRTFSKYQEEWESAWFTINANQVAIDMYDSSPKKLVWRNAGYVNPDAKPQDITKAVSKLLKDYPPKRK